MPANLPEAPEREDEAAGILGASRFDRPPEGGTKVVVLELEKIQPALLIAPLYIRARLFRERQVRTAMTRTDEVALVALCESIERVLADRDEHPETWLAVDFRLPHETVLHQGAERLEEIACRGSEHVEALAKLGQHRLRGEHLYPRRRELDREGQAVEPVHDLGNR